MIGTRIKKLWKDFKRLKKSELQMLVLALAAIGIMGWIGTAVQTQKVSSLVEERDVDATTIRQLTERYVVASVKATVALEEAEVVRSINKEFGLPEYHEVIKGECLWKIAERYFGYGARWPELHRLNRDKIQDPDLIYPGQILKIYDVPKAMDDWEIG